MKTNFQANIKKLYLFKFFYHLHFFGGVLVPFFTDWGGISFTKVMILQSWFMAWIFILEIPTGTIADYWGRKHSLALGTVINIIAVLVYVSNPNFYIFLFAEFLWAVASALYSGADQAFTYDTLKIIGRAKESKKIFARIGSVKLAGLMISAPLGSLIAAYIGIRETMLFMAFPLIIAFFISLTFLEPKTDHKIESKRYLHTLKNGVKYFHQNKILKILALDFIVIQSIAYFMLWAYQPMLKIAGVKIVYFGIVHAGFALMQILFMNNYERLEKLLGNKKRLIFYSAFITGLMFIMGGLTNVVYLIIPAILIAGGLGLGRRELFESYLNKHIPSERRATILSTVSMINKFILVVISPLVGMLIDWSLGVALIILGLIAVGFSFISRVEEKHLID
ncbi:MFS transporter [Patescibacteria group bacterium]|nr:MFS transporter [Patescibacteria group bacterium]